MMDSRWKRAAKTNFFRFWHETVRCSEGRCLLLPDCFTNNSRPLPLPLGIAPSESLRAGNSIDLTSDSSSQMLPLTPPFALASHASSNCGFIPATLLELCMTQLGYTNELEESFECEYTDWRTSPLLREQLAELDTVATCSCSCAGSRSLCVGTRVELDGASVPSAAHAADSWLLEDALGLTPRDTLVDTALGRASRAAGAHFGAREALRVLQALLVFHRATGSLSSDAQSKHVSSPAARNRRHVCSGNASLLAQHPACFRLVLLHLRCTNIPNEGECVQGITIFNRVFNFFTSVVYLLFLSVLYLLRVQLYKS